ncbi:MAG: hypothetical protein Q9163_003163 [Psora crenata]
MLSELSYRHQPHHFPQSTFSRHLVQPDAIDPVSYELSEKKPRQNSFTPSQNASFRERLEAHQEHTHALWDASSSAYHLFPSAVYRNDGEASEHMLRRKTPNGTLAAGYDGSPVEWTKRPHATKHFLMPASNPTQTSNFTSGLATHFPEQSAPQSGHAFAQGAESLQGQQHLYQAATVNQNLNNTLKPDMGRNYSGLTSEGTDSVLNQSTLHSDPFNFAANDNVPTVLQPMWPPCLGPTSIQDPGPFGPYWPNGAFEPYRPAPLRDPRFHNDLLPQYAPSSGQMQPLISEKGGWARSLTGPSPPSTVGCAPPFVKHPPNISPDHGVLPGLQCGSLPHVFHSKLALGNDHQHGLATSNTDSAENTTVGIFVGARSARNGSAIDTGHAQFKEKVLQWAHQTYCDLLASIEQSRRDQHLRGGHGHGGSSFPQPPRRPYPSWSSAEVQGNRSFNKRRRSEVELPTVFGSSSYGSNSFGNVGDVPQQEMRYASPISQDHPPNVSSMRQGQVQQAWFSHNPLPRGHQSTMYPRHAPAQLARDQYATSPSAAAANAIEILSRLCQESQWEWVDGMLLNGCLAYGLGDYTKATKWYLKVLQREPENVEALSNLAATLLSLGRLHEAEQYWMRSIKLRPSYFEAVEHLVGLLHEEQRGEEAIRVIEYVESVLRNTRSPTHGRCDPYSSQYPPGSSGYTIHPSDNGRLLALIHGKGNVMYQSGDNDGAARAFEQAILIGSGQFPNGIHSLIKYILKVFSEQRHSKAANSKMDSTYDEPILLPPETALETSRLVFPPYGILPGLKEVPHGMSQKAAVSIISNSLLSLAKIYQDGMSSSGASATTPRATAGVQEILALYYLSLSLQPSPSTANNVGILLAGVQQSARSRLQATSSKSQTSRIPGVTPGSGVALALAYYDYGLKLDTKHAHLYTNLGSLFKDIGQLSAAISMYEKAVDCDGYFDIALANLANAVKDKGNISDAIKYYRRAVTSNPEFAEAVCGLANALNSVCSWSGRGGITHVRGNRDRWHVDEHGILYDSQKCSQTSSGWMRRVVSIVERQLRDGEGWGKGILRSFGIESMLQRLCPSPDKRLTEKLRQALEVWAEDSWEGAKVVRLVERATKRIGWQIYRERYFIPSGKQPTTRLRPQLPAALAIPSAPTVLPFHTFTCPLSAKDIRKISQRNGLRVSCSTLRAPWLPTNIYEPPPPPDPQLNVGYISSDFNNHPLAHLMQSVFGLHLPSKVRAICYATTASDGSIHRQQIERESPVFHDASSWSMERLVNQVIVDQVHILVNLNGYTRGAKNEVFAARPAPIQMSFMGFAGTLGAEWCDYLLADKVAIPPSTLRPWRGNVGLEDQIRDGNNDDDLDDWVYGENIIFTSDTFFCCDHKQSAPDAQEEQLSWPDEQRRRWKMRKELFPNLADDAIILANFNQLYKIEPTTFRTWLRILSRVPKAVLWLLRFPDLGERNLKQTALQWVGEEVASRIIFTDVAPKHQHIARARICDLFVDTPECNAHTTAADVLWSGTPLLTLPRYEYKMCSRMAASILRGALPKTAEGDRAADELIAADDEAYEEKGVELASDLTYCLANGEMGMGRGRLLELRQLLYESRWTSALFDTRRWVRDLEAAYAEAWRRWVAGDGGDIWL